MRKIIIKFIIFLVNGYDFKDLLTYEKK